MHKPSATSSVSPAVPAAQPAPKPSEPEKYSQQPATPAREMHTASPSHQQPSHPSSDQSINQSTTGSTDQLINRLVNRLTDHSTHRYPNPDDDKVMNKPRAFYITERLNKRIDEAVRYYQEKHGFKKVDRSIVVTALLDNEATGTEEALDAILDKVISHLTSRLTSR